MNLESRTSFAEEIDHIYSLYPLKKGSYAGKLVLKKYITNNDKYLEVLRGVMGYASYVQSSGTKFIKHFSTFCNQRCWLDYLDESVNNSHNVDLSQIKITRVK